MAVKSKKNGFTVPEGKLLSLHICSAGSDVTVFDFSPIFVQKKKYLPFLRKYATLYTKHHFKSGMAVGAAYLSNIRFFIRSGKFMLLFYPSLSIRVEVSACNTQAMILLQTKKEEPYGRKQGV